jgi:hypothetical protein
MLALVLMLLNDGEEAFSALQAFLATPAGRDLEAKLASLLTVTATPGGALIVEPASQMAQRAAAQDAGRVR